MQEIRRGSYLKYDWSTAVQTVTAVHLFTCWVLLALLRRFLAIAGSVLHNG